MGPVELECLEQLGVHDIDGTPFVDQDVILVEVGHLCSHEQMDVQVGSSTGKFLEIEGDWLRFSQEPVQPSISLLNFLFTEFTEKSLNPPLNMTMAEGNFSHLLWVNKGASL